MCLHTCGATFVRNHRRNTLQHLARYYASSIGTHYVVGFDGTIVAVVPEDYVAHGASVSLQNEPGQDWRKLYPAAARHWQAAYGHRAFEPSGLYPGRNFNETAIHIEFIPLRDWEGVTLPSLAEEIDVWGLSWYSDAQYQAGGLLAEDIASRHGWKLSDDWFQECVLEHSAVSPITRSHSGGGWDPGVLRDSPRFDRNRMAFWVETLSQGK
ncbi:MAG: N-acetylmuramoyl-L-alanine amidase [Alphaproteobacteria bacterium]